MSETRLVRRDELLQGDKGGGFRGRQPNACFLDAAICAGLRPADVLVYVKRSQGRENRPYKKRSTVDAKSAAFCKSCSAPKRQTKSLHYHCTTVAHSSNPLQQPQRRIPAPGTDLRKRSHFSRSALRTAPAKAFFIDSIPISFGWTPSTVPSISPVYISSLGRYTRFFQPSAVNFS